MLTHEFSFHQDEDTSRPPTSTVHSNQRAQDITAILSSSAFSRVRGVGWVLLDVDTPANATLEDANDICMRRGAKLAVPWEYTPLRNAIMQASGSGNLSAKGRLTTK